MTENILQPSVDAERSDLFSVGLTGVQMATLLDMSQVYDFTNKSFNDQVLTDRLQNIADCYSADLASLLQEFMLLDPMQRPTFEMALAKIQALIDAQTGEPIVNQGEAQSPMTEIKEERMSANQPETE